MTLTLSKFFLLLVSTSQPILYIYQAGSLKLNYQPILPPLVLFTSHINSRSGLFEKTTTLY